MTPRWDINNDNDTNDNTYANMLKNAFLDMFGQDIVSAAFGGKWEKNERSRAPYTDAWKIDEEGITLFASPTLTHCCVEVSGMGCERLIERGILDVVLARCSERITRIDIASDIETDVMPLEFVGQVNKKRMRASGYQKSESGETCYVGSQKSERYARVYRYNKPHPRAHLLRVECVFRKDYAKAVARACLVFDYAAIASASGEAFGWAHPVWEVVQNTVVDISLPSVGRNEQNTVYWLVHSVAPAFKKLCESGAITTPEEFLARYFLGVEGYMLDKAYNKSYADESDSGNQH